MRGFSKSNLISYAQTIRNVSKDWRKLQASKRAKVSDGCSFRVFTLFRDLRSRKMGLRKTSRVRKSCFSVIKYVFGSSKLIYFVTTIQENNSFYGDHNRYQLNSALAGALFGSNRRLASTEFAACRSASPTITKKRLQILW